MIAPYVQAALEAPLAAFPNFWVAEVEAVMTGDHPFFLEPDEVPGQRDLAREPELAL